MSKFISIEPIPGDEPGGRGEKKVWDAVCSTFKDRECFGYWRYPIFSKLAAQPAKEPDILVADLELGLIVLEVKSIKIDDIEKIDGHWWELKDKSWPKQKPYEQAKRQLQALLGWCDKKDELFRKVMGRVLVALPLITKKEWQERGLDQLPSSPPIIFKDQLEEVSILKQIQNTITIPADKLDDEQWKVLKSVIKGELPSPLPPPPPLSNPNSITKRSEVIAKLWYSIREMDLQQERIAKQIPPGVQRIRGIAGSGKTILLCQKAACMHWKHPEWDIALVIFTRSLYEPILMTVDRWLRHFSLGEAEYDPQNSKLKVLPAWGGRDLPGLYSTICNFHGVKPLIANNITKGLSPSEGLAYACKQLLETTEIKPCFDAILIDEGQDLVVKDDLKFQEKQPIYWLAYQALHPVDPHKPEQRRLIFAYDEAQSLDSLKIPTGKELFGKELSNLFQGNHPGGIQKNEIMRICYRTPGNVITAAHAIGMGLLRREGMLAGITNKNEWKDIGYEVVQGSFNSGKEIILKRPRENSPNPLPDLWQNSVIEFKTYRSRESELTGLAKNIQENLELDGLKASRNILVLVLGSNMEAKNLEFEAAEFLIERGINVFVPTALTVNISKPQFPNIAPNKFWEQDGVTVSAINRAKGNEADMVYIVGLDKVAKDESNLNLRNQLFVALTRTRGWVKISGIGDYDMYEEMRQVIASGETLKFIYQPPQKRVLDELEDIDVNLKAKEA